MPWPQPEGNKMGEKERNPWKKKKKQTPQRNLEYLKSLLCYETIPSKVIVNEPVLSFIMREWVRLNTGVPKQHC